MLRATTLTFGFSWTKNLAASFTTPLNSSHETHLNMIPTNVAFGSISSAFKLAEFGVHMCEVGSENNVFVRTILRVRQDLEETERLLTVPTIKAILEQNVEKSSWIKSSLDGTKQALNDIGQYVEKVRADQDRDDNASLNSLGHRMQWLLDGRGKLKTRQAELTVCHQTLTTILTMLQPLELLSNFNASIIATRPADAWPHLSSGEDFRGPHSRKKSRCRLQLQESDFRQLDNVAFDQMNEYTRYSPRQLEQRIQPPLLLPATGSYKDNTFIPDTSWSDSGNAPRNVLVSTRRHPGPQRRRILDSQTSLDAQIHDAEIQQSTRHYQFPRSNVTSQQSRRISMIVQTDMEGVNVSEGLSLAPGLLNQSQPYRSQKPSGIIEEEPSEETSSEQNYTELPAELSQNSISVEDTTHQFHITKITTKIETTKAYCLLKPFDFEMSKPSVENIVYSEVQNLDAQSSSDTDSDSTTPTPATMITSETLPSTKKYNSSRALIMSQNDQVQREGEPKHDSYITRVEIPNSKKLRSRRELVLGIGMK